MIKTTRNKRNNETSTKIEEESEGIKIIKLKDGWYRINKIGVQPYLKRIENVIDEGKLESVSILKDQFISTYNTIFTMSIQREPDNYSDALYKKHSESLAKHFKETFYPKLDSVTSELDTIFLSEWDKRWKCNKWSVNGMTKFFCYLNRFHVPNSENLLDTTEQGHTLYKEIIFDTFYKYAVNAILNCIEHERNGQEQDRTLLRNSIAVFVELGNKLQKIKLQLYQNNFHKIFIQQTRQYYKQKSRFQLDQCSCPEYLIYAEKCVNDEENRLASYINKYSTKDLMEATHDELLKVHQNELLLTKTSGINSMLERTKRINAEDADIAKEDLSRLYRLYSAVPDGNAKIAKSFKAHIAELGDGFIQNSKNAKDAEISAHQLIKSLIDLHDRFLSIVRVQFEDNVIYQVALKEAFELFINREYRTSALLARYANDLLKKGTKIASTDLENTMDHVVMLYGYIRDKDIFERDYQQYLSSRLLQDLSQSEQSERTMIGKLKKEAGYHWTSKLEDMFKDIQRSKELMQEFNKNKASKDIECELNVSVCTTGAWPTASIVPVKKPQTIQIMSDKFIQFYLSRFSGRRLRFQMDKGKAECSVQFNTKTKKILVVSTYQMIVLLLFNHKNTWTFKQMLERTGINKEDLITAILSMCHPKVKVMRKSPNTKAVDDTHKFQLNPKYTNPRSRIAIPTLSMTGKPKPDGPNVVPPDIERLRKHQMDAAIVRIMKARQTLNHNDLVSEVVRQLSARFKPSPLGIKKRIHCLIELEYLERDSNERALYHYKQ